MSFAPKEGGNQCSGCARYYAVDVGVCSWCDLATAKTAPAPEAAPLADVANEPEDEFSIAVGDLEPTALQPKGER